MREIIKIEAKRPAMPRLTRVAAYARVSNGKDAMLHSLAAQVSYYSELIQSRGDWEYMGVYADEAKTGTKDTRPEFQRLLADCRAGKIDIVITKAISRFARNTVTLLETVRELKALNVDVYFEEQNIHSISNDGELMLTILASYAQEESLSNSENVKWILQKNGEEGKWRRFKGLYGYVWNGDADGNGEFEVNEEQAAIVRHIFSEYLNGKSGPDIERDLNERGIPSYAGKKWDNATILNMIHNEKYMGDVKLNKLFVTDYLTKKVKKNRGEHASYYIRDTFPAIIDRETWNAAQEICKRKNRNDPAFEGIVYPFTTKIWCANCDKTFRSIQRIGGQRYWSCFVHRYKGAASCPHNPIPEYVLFEQTAAVLGFDEWDETTETAFYEKIDRIVVRENGKLVYIFHDGKEVTREWRHKTAAEYKAYKKTEFYAETQRLYEERKAAIK